MLLAIDIGNTQTVIGLFKDDELLRSWRMFTPRRETADEIAVVILSFLQISGFDSGQVKEIAVSCVVPRILFEISRMGLQYFNLKPFVIDSTVNTGIGLAEYDYPKEIGADRIVNAVAAKELYGCPAIVLDFGTATTFDVLSAEGEYLGGAIAPGIEISSEALFNYAAKLSKVDLSWPSSVIGKNSYDGIRSGIMFGFLGQVDFITEKIMEEMKAKDKNFKPKIIATGGLSVLMTGKSRYIQIHDPDLTLKGLKILVEKNR